MKKVLVLGCTGSIGTSAISIIREFPSLFKLCAITAHNNKKALTQLQSEFGCKALLTSQTNCLETFIHESGADICVNGISGSAGLLPSMFCVNKGIDLALANKETIVMASHIVQNIANKMNCRIIPVDSEHSAIFSLIEKYGRENIEKIIITASGGPFRGFTMDELQSVTLEQALKHPTWSMGEKITIDSATLANKGLEVIEACRMFDISPDKIEVTIHPQSLVHSLIRTKDGDVYAQISKPDMRRPILSALTYPRMQENSIDTLDFSKNLDMSFSPPNTKLFPMLELAFKSQKKGGAYTIAYNAANEVAVSLFLEQKISFLDIPKLTAMVLSENWHYEICTIDDVFYHDDRARKITLQCYNDSSYIDYNCNKGVTQ